MARGKKRRARQKSKAPQRAQHGQKAAGEASAVGAALDRKIAGSREIAEQANKSKALPEEKAVEKAGVESEEPELLQRLRRDYNVQHLRDQIAVKVVQKDWRKKVLGWNEETPSQLGRLRNAVLRPVTNNQDWQEQFKTFIETLDLEKWTPASTDKLKQLAEPDSFWQAADIAPPEVEPHFYWRTALSTLLLGALRAHSRERERANPGAD